jgi:DNA-binding protein H-NS
MANLSELQAQINTLQKQAAELKARDFQSTVKEIQSTMSLFGITIKDLQAPIRKQRKSKGGVTADKKVKDSSKVSKSANKPVEAKYSGPEGQTWSGRGLSPKWLAALVAQGAKREDFLIQKN